MNSLNVIYGQALKDDAMRSESFFSDVSFGPNGPPSDGICGSLSKSIYFRFKSLYCMMRTAVHRSNTFESENIRIEFAVHNLCTRALSPNLEGD